MSAPMDQMQLPDMPMLQPVPGPSFGQGLGAFLSSPQATGMAAALLQAGGPSRLPVSLGQALGGALNAGQQYQQQYAQDQMEKMRLAMMQLQFAKNLAASGNPSGIGAGGQ